MPERTAIGDVAPVGALTLTAWQAAELLGYTDRQFRDLVNAKRLPGPIDPELPTKSWRWSRRRLEEYVEGRWAA